MYEEEFPEFQGVEFDKTFLVTRQRSYRDVLLYYGIDYGSREDIYRQIKEKLAPRIGLQVLADDDIWGNMCWFMCHPLGS